MSNTIKLVGPPLDIGIAVNILAKVTAVRTIDTTGRRRYLPYKGNSIMDSPSQWPFDLSSPSAYNWEAVSPQAAMQFDGNKTEVHC